MSIILKEFRAVSQPSLDSLVKVFSKAGRLHRLGGATRVYDVPGENRKAAAFSIGEQLSVIAFGWSASPMQIETIYYWAVFSFDAAPDYAIDLPEGDLAVMAPTILKMIKEHTIGGVDL